MMWLFANNGARGHSCRQENPTPFFVNFRKLIKPTVFQGMFIQLLIFLRVSRDLGSLVYLLV